MNRKRIFAMGKLALLFGTPLALVFGLFGFGVYCGVLNRAKVLRFERDWLGLDVVVPREPDASSGSPPPPSESSAADERVAATDERPDQGVVAGAAKRTAEAGPTSAADDSAPTVAPTEPAPAEPETALAGHEDAAAPAVRSGSATDPAGAVPAPLPAPDARVDALDSSQAMQLAVPVAVRVKVLVDPLVIEQHSDWIDYVQRTVARASHVYEQQFGIRLELVSVGRWMVPSQGLGADDLLLEVMGHSREGAEVLVGFTGRPFDGTTSGTASTPSAGDTFNGAHGVVYATPGHREAHLRTLLHELAHMFGATDIADPSHPGWKGGSWMSYATVPEGQAPWIDPANRVRVLGRKSLPFAPDSQAPEPSAPDGTAPTTP